MKKHSLVPNNFYFMKPNKIVKRQISLFSHGQAHLTADHFFFSQAQLNSHCSPFIIDKKKKKTKARISEDVHAFKNCLELNKEQNPRRKCLTTSIIC